MESTLATIRHAAQRRADARTATNVGSANWSTLYVRAEHCFRRTSAGCVVAEFDRRRPDCAEGFPQYRGSRNHSTRHANERCWYWRWHRYSDWHWHDWHWHDRNWYDWNWYDWNWYDWNWYDWNWYDWNWYDW